MEAVQVLDIGRDTLWVVVKISFPIMMASMFFGLLTSLIQAITQIQEATLSFVPKMLAIFVVILITLPFIGKTLLTFSEKIMIMIQNI